MVKYWKDIISKDMEEMDKENAVVLLPISAIEQHGSHLPVGTDSIILEALLAEFVKEKDFEVGSVLVAPQLYVGKSNEHMGFCGTLTLTAKTLYSVIEELTASIVKSGFKRIILTNSHGGNTDLLNLIARDLRITYGIAVYVFDWWFTNFWADILKEEKQSQSPYGVFHACELETSLVLAIAPETVNKDRIVDETPDEMFQDEDYISLFGPINIGWKTKDVTKSGVIGTPSLATAAKGEKFMSFAVDKLAAIVSEVLRFQY
jgi:creatinine amidohydrolase